MRVTLILLLSLLIVPTSPAPVAADDLQMMRLFSDMTMSKSRATNDGVRATADAYRANAQANLSNANAYAERMRGRQLEIDGDRAQVLVGQMKRDLRLQNRADMASRREAQTLRERKSQLTQFFSGQVTAANTRAFLWSTTRVPYSASFRQYLGRDVQALDGAQFKSTMPIFEILLPTGELRRPPLSMMGRQGSELYLKRKEFEEIWQRFVSALRYDRDLDYDHYVAVAQRMERWKAICQDRVVTDAARRDAKHYLTRLNNVVRCLETQNGLERMQALVKNEGLKFHGGTCGQLLQHIQDWSLQVESGSQAQLLLAEFGDECLGSIANEISVAQNLVQPAMINPSTQR